MSDCPTFVASTETRFVPSGRRTTSLLCTALALFAWGCGSSSDGAGQKQTPAESKVGSWQSLLTGDWTMPPGVEDYVCVRYTLTEDVYIHGVEAINPLGTHHTLLTIGEPSKPDGTTACNVAENLAVPIFGSGVGTNPVEFPEGVGIKLDAGKQLLLNLHLFNTNDTELSGTSGTRVLTVDPDDIQYHGQEYTVVRLDLDIPPQKDTTTEVVYTLKEDATLFAVLPHMHQLGIHAKVTAESSIDGTRVLHDDTYDFDNQLYYPVDSTRLAKGDTVRYECTWRNTTNRTINFGDSSLDEMCAIGLYNYPTP